MRTLSTQLSRINIWMPVDKLFRWKVSSRKYRLKFGSNCIPQIKKIRFFSLASVIWNISSTHSHARLYHASCERVCSSLLQVDKTLVLMLLSSFRRRIILLSFRASERVVLVLIALEFLFSCWKFSTRRNCVGNGGIEAIGKRLVIYWPIPHILFPKTLSVSMGLWPLPYKLCTVSRFKYCTVLLDTLPSPSNSTFLYYNVFFIFSLIFVLCSLNYLSLWRHLHWRKKNSWLKKKILF